MKPCVTATRHWLGALFFTALLFAIVSVDDHLKSSLIVFPIIPNIGNISAPNHRNLFADEIHALFPIIIIIGNRAIMIALY